MVRVTVVKKLLDGGCEGLKEWLKFSASSFERWFDSDNLPNDMTLWRGIRHQTMWGQYSDWKLPAPEWKQDVTLDVDATDIARADDRPVLTSNFGVEN